MEKTPPPGPSDQAEWPEKKEQKMNEKKGGSASRIRSNEMK